MKPIRKIVSVPPWEQRAEREGELLLRLSLGRGAHLAFGFGGHESTSLVLALLGGLYGEQGPRPRSVLDVGCGSGILSIACARLGATRALGLDIEEEALRIAPENAAANGVAQICRFERTAVADVAGTFDLVLANILAPVLRELRPVLCARARGGMLVLSGFKEKNRDELVASYEAEGLRLKTELERDGWHTVLLRAAEVSR